MLVRMGDCSTPSEFIQANYLSDETYTLKSLAEEVGLSESNLRRLMKNEVDLTAKVALKLEVFSGISAEEWLELGNKATLEKARYVDRIESKKNLRRLHIMIDGENCVPKDLEVLKLLPNVKLWYLGGAKDKVELSYLNQLEGTGVKFETIAVSHRASNALDFHITYLIGRLSVEEPCSEYIVVSSDSGYDPLLVYLSKTGHKCRRIQSFAQLRPPTKKEKDECVNAVLIRFKQLDIMSYPKTKSALMNFVGGLRTSLSGEDALQQLIERKLIIRSKNADQEYIAYDLENLQKALANLSTAAKNAQVKTGGTGSLVGKTTKPISTSQVADSTKNIGKFDNFFKVMRTN